MKKQRIYRAVVILIFLINHNAVAQQLKLLKTTPLDYPSASALEFYNNQLFVVGDDATHLLILNSNHAIKDSVRLFRSKTPRIPKDEKVDIESLTIIRSGRKLVLLAMSSFSTPARNKFIRFHLPRYNRIRKTSVPALASRLQRHGIAEVNLEGIATVGETLIVINRANNTHRTNCLLTLPIVKNFKRSTIEPGSIEIVLPGGKSVIGLSGLTYVSEKDLLIFSASTEETADSYSDGAIGKSYLGYIINFSQRKGQKKLEPTSLLDLSAVLKKEKEKIESVCVEKNNGNTIMLHLAADNDDGKSVLYKIEMKLD